MELIRTIISSFEFEAFIKLFLGFILAGIIGAERESENKPAGFKTHSLIGISAVLIMLCGKYYSSISGSDAARIPAQLLSGIGFIGAGTILRDGLSVKGLTTAASLLAVTCIGLSIGAGFYLGGIIATVIVYIILRHSHSFNSTFEHYYISTIRLKVDNYLSTLELIQAILEKYDVNIRKIRNNQKDEKSKEDVLISFKYHKNTDINSLCVEISSLDDVRDLEIE